MSRFLTCCAALICLTVQFAVSQGLQFENIHFSSTKGFNKATDNSLGLLYRERGLDAQHSRFFYTTFDSSLQKNTANIQLYKRNQVLASVSNNSFSAHLFQRVGYDSLKIVWLNRQGQLIRKNEYRHLPNTPRLVDIFKSDSDSAFHFFYKIAGAKGFIVKKVNVLGDTLWSRKLELKGHGNFYRAINDQNNLWIISSGRGAKRIHTIFCVEQTSGTLLSEQQLHKEQDRRGLIETAIGPNQELLIIGRWFNKRISSSRPGRFFMTSIKPTGERPLEMVATDTTHAAIAALSKTKLLWQSINWNPAGHWELVGETFNNTSWLTTVAIGTAVGIATMGMVRVNYAALTTKDMVHLRLSATGDVLKTNSHSLSSTRMVSSWAPAFEMAKLAKANGYFRYRGVIANPYLVIVNTKKDIQVIVPGEQKPFMLFENTRKSTAEIIGILDKQIIIYDSAGGNNLLVRKLALPDHLLTQPSETTSSLNTP